MITPTKAFTTTDGTTHAELERAQAHELSILISKVPNTATSLEIGALLVEKREAVLDILTTNGRSRPKARKINGAKRAAKAKPVEAKPVEKP
jgi:hypothetical protein